ncbi:hypothetical protein B9Z65_3638 [Elsinoe australis]|uniref:Uncharacterized protein n=1 Tax=Elsinoe australis TaxID=40998 RepID=A0A2P8AFR9_9PEZI|nr:hypothetical protein B9Z65_3638 [Elsinoe australis]
MPVRAFFRDLTDRFSSHTTKSPPTNDTKSSSYFDSPNKVYNSKTITTTSVSSFYTPTYQKRGASRTDHRPRTASPSTSTSRLSPPGGMHSSASARSAKSSSPNPRRKLRLQVPLYIYPTTTSWDPLFTALAQHPTVQFDIIINPASGPGASAAPDANYVAQVTRLNSYPNATLFGYVHVSWAERSLEDVFADVRTYEKWNQASRPASPKLPPTSASAMKVSSPLRPSDSGVTLPYGPGSMTRKGSDGSAKDAGMDIHISGIFVDEAPYHENKLQYMSSLHAYIRRTLSRGGTVWTNPGCPVPLRFYEYADKVTCFEDSHVAWLDRGLEGFEGGRAERRKSTVMVHTCSREGREAEEVVRKCREEGVEGVFVTADRGYEGWGHGWGEVCKAVEEAQ